MKPILQDERENLDQILGAHGYRPDDFDATSEEDPPPVHGAVLLYAISSTVTVGRRSTDQVRQYRGTPFSVWLIEGFQHDLEAGLFGAP